MGRFNTQRRLDARKRHPKGYSLIEILVVISLIGVVMAITVTNVISLIDEANIKATKVKIKQVADQVVQHRVIHDEYPGRLEDKVRRPNGRSGPMKADALKDAWKNPWAYKSGERDFDLSSAGVDEDHGTEDDIHHDEDT
ncbi:MAG: type II secretion system protein GspG [Bradymonadia bacterium]